MSCWGEPSCGILKNCCVNSVKRWSFRICLHHGLNEQSSESKNRPNGEVFKQGFVIVNPVLCKQFRKTFESKQVHCNQFSNGVLKVSGLIAISSNNVLKVNGSLQPVRTVF